MGPNPCFALAERKTTEFKQQYAAEEKIRIVLEGLRGKENISELCHREGIDASMYDGW